ncbi:TlpA family protein disulfide reductase [Aestuariibaculum sp. M13]|uniref:TlpA family protein disulfide reductase n=1 Tax=Aestuariibaculum sp. M13 TaxID=2967132 RepID=UPI00215A03CC|nr:TlpA disulfide reductase family protein [Aestuariibaculum sp. M13]MCR8668238.1 TlpA family protein disulfide reductase [Aestuariibaculum sp. M13]
MNFTTFKKLQMHLTSIKINSCLKLVLFLGLILMNCHAQGQQQKSDEDWTTIEFELPNKGEEKDWEYLNYIFKLYCKTKQQCEYLEKANLWQKIKYSNDLYTTRSKVVEDFLNKYPNSPHFYDAVIFFLGSPFRPGFIPVDVDSTVINTIAELKKDEGENKWLKADRLLPIDFKARELWLKKGEGFVAQILHSDAPIEIKIKIEQALYNRDIGMALIDYSSIPKPDNESDYWKTIDNQFWRPVWDRLLALLEKYPESERLGTYTMVILNSLSRDVSSELSKEYRNDLYEKVKNRTEKGCQIIIKSIEEYIKAEIMLVNNSGGTPLEMEFYTLQGDKMLLSDLKGKVVLFDFWFKDCKPCIAAMPHLKKLYEEYKDQGFEIIGIVCNGDEAKPRIQEILNNANVDWPQHLDKGKNAKVSYHKLFQISSFPTMWLLDKNGRIVNNDIELNQLYNELPKYLNENE